MRAPVLEVKKKKDKQRSRDGDRDVEERKNASFLSPAMSKIVEQTKSFSLDTETDLGKGIF